MKQNCGAQELALVQTVFGLLSGCSDSRDDLRLHGEAGEKLKPVVMSTRREFGVQSLADVGEEGEELVEERGMKTLRFAEW